MAEARRLALAAGHAGYAAAGALACVGVLMNAT